MAHKNNCKIMQLNVCGMSENCCMALNHYLHSNSIDVVCLSETKAETIQTSAFPGMTTILKPNSANPRQRGVAVLVKEGIEITRHTDLEPSSLDLLICTISLEKRRYILCSVYSPPNNRSVLEATIRSLEYVNRQTARLNAEGILVIGDLNARHQHWGDHAKNIAGELVDAFAQRCQINVMNLHGNPTFLCDNGYSTIDLLMLSTNITGTIIDQQTDDTVELFTGAPRRGHVPVISVLQLHKPHITPTTYPKWSKTDWVSFGCMVEAVCENTMPYFTTNSDPNQMWRTLKEILLSCKQHFVPVGKTNTHNKPYWNARLTELSKELRKARRQFKLRSSYVNGDQLDSVKAEFDSELTKAKNDYLMEKSDQLSNDDGTNFWKNFKNVFYHADNRIIGDLVDAETHEVISHDHQKADLLFKNAFGGGPVPQPHHDTQNSGAIQSDGSHHANADSLSAPITIMEIQHALSKLKTSGKSADYDGIHPLMLKQGNSFFQIALHCLFNAVLKSHIWPWYDSNLVIFLRKPGKKTYTDTGSYRPITLSSHVAKTLERIMEHRLREYVESSSIIPDSQFGFRSKRGTQMYLLQLISQAQNEVKHNKQVAALFLDLQKAFDTVQHSAMLQRLHNIGISGAFAAVTKAFLTSRQIQLKVNDYIRPAEICTRGLPQGSVLSPLLFIIFIRDMLNNIHGTGLQFADDCTILMSASNQTELQETMDRNCATIHHWMEKWQLKVNCSKTEIVVFNGQLSPPLLGTGSIQIVGSSRALGVMIDSKLSFSAHIASSINTLNNKMNLLKPFIFSGLHCDTALRILNQVILPKVLYASSVWNVADSVSLYPHLNVILGGHFNPSSDALHMLSGVMTTRMMATRERLQIIRNILATNMTHIITSTSKSPITKLFTADSKKLIPRNFTLEQCKATDFSKAKVKKLLTTERERQWKMALLNGQCQQGLLAELSPDHLLSFPIPLGNPRKVVGYLCDLLTGHSKLQLFQYIINKTYSPTCSCLAEDETPSHFLYRCKDFSSLRSRVQPNPFDWDSLIEYTTLSGRLA